MTHRCQDCEGRPRFSVKTVTVMQSSKLGYLTWTIAAYLVTTCLKGVSSMKLHRDLEITQNSACHLMHRHRKTYESGQPLFEGPSDADETYIGGQEENKHAGQKLNAVHHGGGKSIVVDVKDRESNQIAATVISDAKAKTLQGFIESRTELDAQV